MKKIFNVEMIVLIIVIMFFVHFKIDGLENQIDRMERKINDLNGNINSNMVNIYSNIDQKLEEEASAIHKAQSTVGKIDAQNHIVPITFTVEPKEVSESTEVFLKFNEETLKLNKNGTTYSGVKDFSLFQDDIAPSIIIENNGIQQLEKGESLKVYNLKEQVLTILHPHYMGGGYSHTIGSDKYKYRQDGTLILSEMPNQDAIKNIDFITYIDGNKVKEEKIIREDTDLNNSYNLTKGQVLTSYIVATDKLGFIYEYPIEHFVTGNKAQREPYYKDFKVTTKEGKVIYDSTAREE